VTAPEITIPCSGGHGRHIHVIPGQVLTIEIRDGSITREAIRISAADAAALAAALLRACGTMPHGPDPIRGSVTA
jgi:hypothetical protein